MMKSLRSLLYTEPYRFEFFQAVRLLQFPVLRPVGQPVKPDSVSLNRPTSAPQVPVGYSWTTAGESVHFRALPSLTFPPSEVYELTPPQTDAPQSQMTVTFFGLYGPSGALPTHYTQLILDLERDVRGEERRALRAWLDLFNHRLTSLFYRAWEKYRFELPFERGAAFLREPDTFTQALFSFIGLGQPSLRNRLAISLVQDQDTIDETPEPTYLARIDDLALLHYGGFLAHRPRNQVSLQAILQVYFELQVAVLQFQGQWLPISPEGQTQIGMTGSLGVDAVAGARVWEIQSKFRVRLGPLPWQQFQDFMPDRCPSTERKSIFLVMHLIRFYAGPELDFDIQLVLDRHTVPPSQLDESSPVGLRLGWNTWMVDTIPAHDLDDAVFEGVCVTKIPAL